MEGFLSFVYRTGNIIFDDLRVLLSCKDLLFQHIKHILWYLYSHTSVMLVSPVSGRHFSNLLDSEENPRAYQRHCIYFSNLPAVGEVRKIPPSDRRHWCIPTLYCCGQCRGLCFPRTSLCIQ